MQDEIVARLANALNAQLAAAEARRAEQAPSPDSMDLYFQGLARINKGQTPDNVARARSFFDRALIADSGNVDALSRSARTDIVEGNDLIVTNPTSALAEPEGKTDQGPGVGPGPSACPYVLKDLSRFSPSGGNGIQGIAKCEHALALDRNLAHAHNIIGLGKVCIGRAEETESHVAEALRLSPRDTMAYLWMNVAGVAKLHLGTYEQAVAWLRRSCRRQPKLSSVGFSFGRRPLSA